MLQTYLESQQFNFVPNPSTNTRSRNSYITTDRPDSSQLVDLHVYIIPKTVWKNVQHLAQNEAMDDAISAGFVRVSPDMKLHNLRDSIEQLCGTENYFPRDFIFLRSVGRCLTRVKQTQENELKVKNYRPPQTIASEIYLLEGRHEDYANIPSASPALSSASYLFGNRYQQRLNLDDIDRSPSRPSHHYHHKPLRSDKKHLPLIDTKDVLSHVPTTLENKNFTKLPQVGSDLETSSPKELFKLREENERLRKRQADLDRMRRAVEGNERRQRRQEKIQSNRDEEERHRRRRQEKFENERIRRRLDQEAEAATKIQASFRGFKDRQLFRERQKNIIKNTSPISSSKSNKTIENEKKTDINDDELSDGSQILSRSSSIGSTSDVDTNPSRPETRTIKKEARESIHSNSSSLLSMKNEDVINSSMENDIDKENIRSGTVTKIRCSEDEIVPISTPDINKDDDDTYELERRAGESKRRQQSEEDKRKAKELEERRPRRQIPKRQQREDPESLRTRLQEIRTGRIDLEKLRDEIIKRLKYMHNRITLRRKEARDMWKKKYFHEKKKTPSIEDRTTQLKTDLDQIHTRIVQTIDNECKHTAQVGHLKEAEIGDFILQITRIKYEIQTIHHQIDQAKLRLTTDIKLRNQAENECETLKHELTQAKMNLNYIRNRIEV